MDELYAQIKLVLFLMVSSLLGRENVMEVVVLSEKDAVVLSAATRGGFESTAGVSCASRRLQLYVREGATCPGAFLCVRVMDPSELGHAMTIAASASASQSGCHLEHVCLDVHIWVPKPLQRSQARHADRDA